VTYAFVEDIAASWERYERFAAAFEGPLPDGLLLHAAGPTDEGFRIIGIWESEDAWLRFASRLVGDDAPPSVVRTLRPAHVVYGERGDRRMKTGSAQPTRLTEKKGATR
jgi:hypothetical protein